jgi:hypothetical protein
MFYLHSKLEGDTAGSPGKVEEGGAHPSGVSMGRWRKMAAW